MPFAYDFHAWRARVWKDRVVALTTRLQALAECEELYGANYSAEMHSTVCARVEAAGAFAWHAERASKLEPYYC